MSKYCTVCGTEIEDQEIFCSNCGNRVKTQEQPVQQQNPYERPVEQAQQNQYVQTPLQQAQPIQRSQNFYQPDAAQPNGQPPYYYAPPVRNVPQSNIPAKKPGKGFGIASLVLGILSFANSLILLIIDASASGVSSYDAQNNYESYATLGLKVIIITFAIFVGICAVLSLVFGIISVVKAKRGTAITGLILSGLALAVVVFSFIVAANLKHPTTNENLYNNFYSFNEKDFEEYFDNYNFDID